MSINYDSRFRIVILRAANFSRFVGYGTYDGRTGTSSDTGTAIEQLHLQEDGRDSIRHPFEELAQATTDTDNIQGEGASTHEMLKKK